MKKLLALFLAGAMMFSLAACGGDDTKETEPAKATAADTKAAETKAADTKAAETKGAGEEKPAGNGETYKIGLAAMLTGDNALNGERMQKASEMVIAQYNEAAGYEKFVLNTEDDLTTNEGALTAVQKLISDGCLAIIGPHRSSAALAVSDTVAEQQVCVLVGGTSVAIDGSNNYMFRTRASDAIMATVAATFCKDTLEAKKVGILHASDEYGQGGADAAMAFFDAQGIEYVDCPHNVNDVDFTSAILECQSAGCDTVFTWTHDAETAIIYQQLATYMPDVNKIASPGLTLDNVLNLCEDSWVDGAYSVTDFISTSTDAVAVDFVKAYQDLYGETPDLYAAAYYGAAVTICEAILACEEAGEVTPQAVRDAIAAGETKTLPTGDFYNDDANNLVHSCVIAKLNGKAPEFVQSVNE
ncbi:MAG: amino acid ABC transporter substrate-binding protein [Lachnospiraceae bacterium]|nr:amino acid ABC transporter substrate-binding protein [Lachnospiraceae bacterium]